MWFTAYGPCDWSIRMLWIQEGVLSAVKATADSPSWWTLPRNLTAAFMLQSQCRSESCSFLFLLSLEKMWINGQSPNYWPSTSSCTLSHGLPVIFFFLGAPTRRKEKGSSIWCSTRKKKKIAELIQESPRMLVLYGDSWTISGQITNSLLLATNRR